MERYSWNICDELLESPHVLIAGTTGSGKSVFLNSMIFSIINTEGIMFLIDLKRVELARYSRLKRCCGVATEPQDVLPLLKTAVEEMESRYKAMKGTQSDDVPVYIIVDELADLVYSCPKECLDLLVKIGRLGRAANMHLICATQDPSKKTLSAPLMQNFTTRVALRCFSPIESRQIIGEAGAETLPRYGEALVRDANGIRRVQVPYTPEEDILPVVEEESIPHSREIISKVLEILKFIILATFKIFATTLKIVWKMMFWRL